MRGSNIDQILHHYIYIYVLPTSALLRACCLRTVWFPSAHLPHRAFNPGYLRAAITPPPAHKSNEWTSTHKHIYMNTHRYAYIHACRASCRHADMHTYVHRSGYVYITYTNHISVHTCLCHVYIHVGTGSCIHLCLFRHVRSDASGHVSHSLGLLEYDVRGHQMSEYARGCLPVQLPTCLPHYIHNL